MVNEENTSNANLNSTKQIPYYITYNYPTQARGGYRISERGGGLGNC